MPGEPALPTAIELGQPPPEVPGTLTIAPVPDHFSIAPEAQALGAQGETLPVALDVPLAFVEKAGIEELRIPVAVPEGKELKMFHDPASGFALAGDEATLPLKDIQGTVLGTLQMDLGPVVGSAQGARAPVEDVRLITPEVTEDFSKQDPEVGEVEVQISVDLKDVPQGAQLKVDPELNISAKEETLFRQAAQAEDLAVKDFAYQVKVEKQNLKPEAATITLKVDPKWVEAQGGPEQVRIFRDDEQGSVTVLPTFYTGLDEEGHAVFVAPSPGLSVFSLAAVEGAPAKAQARPATPPWGLIALVAAVGIAVGIVLGSRGPPGGRMNPWLRMAMKSSGELKGAEEIRERKTAVESGASS